MSASVDVSIVAFRNRDEIAECVARARGIDGLGRVVVVDHGDDGCGDVAGAAGAVVVADPSNPGFGAGHNGAVARLSAPYVLLLNPDALVEPAAIAHGVRLLQENPDVVAVQGVIVGADGAPERSQGVALGPQHLAGRALGARALLGMRWARALARRTPALRDHVERVPCAATSVESLSATVLLLRRSAFAAVGGFDERFFLYGEDVDLCRRLRASGGRLVAVADVWARHRSGGSFRTSWEREVEWWRGSLRLAAMTWSGRDWAVARWASLLTVGRLVGQRPSARARVWSALVTEPRAARAERFDGAPVPS